MAAAHKYSRIEWERRFLLARFPENTNVLRTRHIADRYVDGTNLRLRQQRDDGGETLFKLTQKVPSADGPAQQGFITSVYLSPAEYSVLAQLPAQTLTKTRYSVPPFGIDVFDGDLEGLILAEAEFDSAADASSLILPAFIRHEVTTDPRFTGGRLARATRSELAAWLLEYGITLDRR